MIINVIEHSRHDNSSLGQKCVVTFGMVEIPARQLSFEFCCPQYRMYYAGPLILMAPG